MSKIEKPGLMATLRASMRGNKGARYRAEDDDNSDIDDDEEGEDENQSSPDAVEDGEDGADAEETGDDDEKAPDETEDEDEETGPAASSLKSARVSATKKERARCLAIISHANADAQPELSAKLLTDGTPKSRAMGLLDAVGASATKSSNSLASRIQQSQGANKPGQDGAGASNRNDKASNQLVQVASGTFGRRKKQQAGGR